MYRLFTLIAALLALATTGLATAATAAPATYPALRLEANDAGFDFPAEVPAGRYLVTVDNARQQGIAPTFVLPPAGHTVAEAQAALASPDPASAWLYGATFIGGPYARAGQRAQAIVDLTPGDWLLWADQSADTPPPALTVTAAGSVAPVTSEPESSATVELREYSFGGLELGVPAGPQTWKFTNTGEQPHLVDVIKAPRAVTFDEVMTLLMLPDGATPPAGVPGVEAYEGIAGIGTLSPGQTAWLILPDLEPGTYVAMCFVPDRDQGAPHALIGMVQIFTVGAPATPAP